MAPNCSVLHQGVLQKHLLAGLDIRPAENDLAGRIDNSFRNGAEHIDGLART